MFECLDYRSLGVFFFLPPPKTLCVYLFEWKRNSESHGNWKDVCWEMIKNRLINSPSASVTTRILGNEEESRGCNAQSEDLSILLISDKFTILLISTRLFLKMFYEQSRFQFNCSAQLYARGRDKPIGETLNTPPPPRIPW